MLLHEKLFLDECRAEIAHAFKVPEQIPISVWAERHRRMSGEASAKRHGRWRNLPMQVEPMNAVQDPEVRTTVLQWASQTAGKTEVLNNIVGYFIQQEPCPMLLVQPDLILAETWSNDRLAPMIRDTPCLRDLMADRYGSYADKTLHKSFPGGHMTMAGANSPASLAMRPVQVNLFDEVDRYPLTAGKEGDPIYLALKRSDTFQGTVDYRTSTPTIFGHSRIEAMFKLSDQRYWHLDCPVCSQEQVLKWKQVKWKDEDHLEDTWYECLHCQAHWDDRMRISAIRAGRWKATAKFKGIRGYHISGIYSLFRQKKTFKSRLHQMAVEFLEANRLGKQALQVWTNTFLAETWKDDEIVKPEVSALYNRREPYVPSEKIPQGVQLITFGTDFQADRVEVEFVGYGSGEESWGLGHHKLYGDTRLPELYQRLETLLLTQFTREDGITLQACAGGFDTGYAGCQRQLYAFLRPRLGRRYYAFKGSSQKNSEPISHSAKSKVESVKLIMVGTNRLKTYLYTRASIAVNGAGMMHFPEAYPEEWFKQFLAEDWKPEIINGTKVWVFSMPEVILPGASNRNEALDIRVYSLAALYARGVPNWDFEFRRNARRAELLAKSAQDSSDDHTIITPESVSAVAQVESRKQKFRKFRRKTVSLLSGLNQGL